MLNVCTSITWFWLFSHIYVRSTQFYQSLWFSKLQLTVRIYTFKGRQKNRQKKKKKKKEIGEICAEQKGKQTDLERRKADHGIESTLTWRHIIMKVRRSKESHWTGAKKAEKPVHLCRSLSMEDYPRRQGIKFAWAIQQSPASSTK